MAYNWRRIKNGIINKFKNNGYRVYVEYENNPDIHPTYNVTVYDCDSYGWHLIDEVEDDYNLSQNYHDEGDGYDFWQLFDDNN